MPRLTSMANISSRTMISYRRDSGLTFLKSLLLHLRIAEGETMRTFIQPSFVLILFVLVRAADLAIGAAISRAIIQAVAYGLVAILALLAVLLVPLGL